MNQYNTQIFKQVKTKIVSTHERKRSISPIQTNKTVKKAPSITPSNYYKTIVPSTTKRLPKCSSSALDERTASSGGKGVAEDGHILNRT